MRKAVFLDRDGTINVEKNYLYQIEAFEYLPGVKAGLRKLQEAGFLLIVVTNQSGIGRGYYTGQDYQKLDEWMKQDLSKDGIVITASYHCPHHPEVECHCRKPEIGLFEKAVWDYEIDLTKSYAIGDKLRDLSLCERREGNSIKSCRAGYLLYADQNREMDRIRCLTGGLLEAAMDIIDREKRTREK